MVKIITLPFSRKDKTFFEDLVNKFLLNKKVNSLKAEFFQVRTSAYWTVFIDYDAVVEERQKRPVIKLSESDELLVRRLKEWRRERAEKELLPVYIVATNKVLLSIVLLKPGSKEALKEVKGLGKTKIEKYGDDILNIVRTF